MKKKSTTLNDDDGPDPTIDGLCYLLSLVIKTVNPSINREVAHDLLSEMLETEGGLSEVNAVEVGHMIRTSSEFRDPEELH